MSLPNGGYYRDLTSTESGRVFLDLEMVMGAAGAVPAMFTSSFPHSGRGLVASVVKGGTGVYTVTFTAPWVDLLSFKGWTIQAAYSAAGACKVEVTANAIGNATPTVTLLVVTAAGAAVNPTTNDIVYLNFELQSYDAG